LGIIDRVLLDRQPLHELGAVSRVTTGSLSGCPEQRREGAARREYPYTSPVSGVSEPRLGARFERVECVGAGGFGEVHRAVDRETGRPVAIKRLHPHLAESVSIGRLWREGELLSRIDSPYVVRHVAHGFDDEGRACLVLEWLDGTDVSQLAKSRRLSVAEAVEIVRQAALGLAALHDAGIVHRDVKPGNFFAVPAGAAIAVKLIDLGVARAEDPGETTNAGEIVGTPTYMSPEQARGERSIGPASDLFGLGVMLYQLLSGRRPFTGADPFAVLAKIILEEPPPLREIVPHLAPGLGAIVATALSKDPTARFASARQMSEAIASAPVSGDEAPPGLDETPTMQVSPSVLSPTREQRVVTALFAHFRRSRGEASVETVDRAMDLFTTLAGTHSGVAYRALGDRMIAVFGAARSSGDDAARAARASLALLGDAGRAVGLGELPRLAITTGRAVPSASGLGGQTLERGAAEIERGRPGEIRIDPMTARTLGPSFLVETRPSGTFLIGERGPVGGRGPRLLGKETPFVGRARELEILEAALRECIQSPVARVLLVTGEAGIGKSRLCHELIKAHVEAVPRMEILLGRGDPLRVGSPFGLLSDAIRRSAGILDGEERKPAQRKLRARVGAHMSGRAHARATLFLGELCGLPFPDGTSQALRAARSDPVLMGDGMRRAFEDWLAAETDALPVVLVLEDLHLGDVATVSFVESTLRNLRASPLFVLGLARPEVHAEFPGLWSKHAPRELRLESLDDEASRALARASLPDVAQEEIDFIAARAEGNPFYLEELIRMAAAGTDGALPETALGMVQARLDALGPEAKLVLRAASVFGGTFWRDGVAALLGPAPLGGDALDRCLDDLAHREVVVRRSAPRRRPDEYAFQSALVRDAAYATLTDEDREKAHLLAADWLERAREGDASMLAEHCARGGDPGRAVDHCLRGARAALEGHDLPAAIERAQRGVEWGAEGETLGLCQLLQAEAYRWLGSFAECADRGAQAAARLPVGSAVWFRAVAEIVTASGRMGQNDDVIRWIDRARAAEPIADPARLSLADVTRQRDSGFDSVFPASEGDLDDAPNAEARRAKVICLARGALQLFYASRGGIASEVLALAESLAGPLASVEPVAQARLHQTRALSALFAGEPGRYVAEHEMALAAFEAAHDDRSACQELVSLGSGYAELGDLERATTALEKAIDTAEKLGLTHVAPWARQNLAGVLLSRGETDRAEAMAASALEAGDSASDKRLAGGAHIYLARAALARGDTDRAIREARLAEELLTGAPALSAVATATLSRALYASGELDGSLRAAIRATACLEALGEGNMGEGESAVRLALVLVLAARGEESARDALEVARRRLLARAERIDDAELRRRFLEDVPDHRETLTLDRLAAADASWPRRDA
jgi:eukaryotic-like serine/threonine-protein kinase